MKRDNFQAFLEGDQLFFAMDDFTAVLYDSLTLELLDKYVSKDEVPLVDREASLLEVRRGSEIQLNFFEES